MDDKKTQFKTFVSAHPELVSFVKNKEMSWQDFYEIYDIYGEESSAWEQYFATRDSSGTQEKLAELAGIFKNINMDTVQKYVNNAQKAINIIQELTKKGPETVVKSARPITKFYGD